jgi:hypothetical protein
MIKTLKRATLIVLAMAVMFPAGLAFAAGSPDGVTACTGDNVQGKIIAVDENGVITIDTGAGICTVTLNGNYNHPIVTLLGTYFGDIQAGDLSNALQNVQGCATVSGTSGTWADCSDQGAVPVQFVSFDGSILTAIIIGSGETITIPISDTTVAASITQALADLTVNWILDGNGDLVQVSDQIAMYHDEGIGFGVLVKLYSLANASGVPVADLIAAFKGDPSAGTSGKGLGQLFKEYGGKPPLLGVGQVRKALKNSQNDQTTTTTTEGNNSGKSKGKAKGKNNGKANGKNKDKGNNPTSQGSTTHPGVCIPKNKANPKAKGQFICP